MKALKIIMVMSILLLTLVITGCRHNHEMTSECQRAYEQDKQVYDYVGGMPEECKD